MTNNPNKPVVDELKIALRTMLYPSPMPIPEPPGIAVQINKLAGFIQAREQEATLNAINKVFTLSPKGSFNNWKPTDAWRFYERLKAYEREVKGEGA